MVKVNKRNTHYHYYLRTKPEVNRVDLGHFHVVYDNFIKSLTQGFSERDWIDFYAKEDLFIESVAREFGKTRMGHFILFTWNEDRIRFLISVIPQDKIEAITDYANTLSKTPSRY